MGAGEPKSEAIGGSWHPKISAGLRPGRQNLRPACGQGGKVFSSAFGRGRQQFMARPPDPEATFTPTFPAKFSGLASGRST